MILNESLHTILGCIDDFIWSYLGIYFVLFSGIYFSIKSKGFQFKVLSDLSIYRKLYAVSKDTNIRGINPFKLYFASVGGMIGLGNLVVVVTSITAGGPGALFWIWSAAFAGMLIKYSEIFLGVKFRKHNAKEGYDGGPMFYLKRAFNNDVIPVISCILLCIYGAEVTQFKIISDTISHTFKLNWIVVAAAFALLILYSSVGGVKRLAAICTVLMPFFMMILCSNVHLGCI